MFGTQPRVSAGLSHQYFYISDLSKAVLLTWLSVLLGLVSVSVLFAHSLCLDDFS